MKNNITGIISSQHRNRGIIILILSIILFTLPAFSSEKKTPVEPGIVQAAMCEEIKDGRPWNRGVLFSIEKGKVLCFSTFENIPEPSTIFHKWFYRDKLIYKIKLSLNPPRWSTYSSIKLRDADRGPWRVEITDQKNNIYQTLRFSIVD